MRRRAFIFEHGIQALLSFSLFPAIYGVHEIYRVLSWDGQNGDEVHWFGDIGLIVIFSVIHTVTLIGSFLIFHIPVSLFLRKKRAGKKPFQPLPFLGIILGVHFGIFCVFRALIIILDLPFRVNGYSELAAALIVSAVLYVPSFLVVICPPMLTVWRYGQPFEYIQKTKA